ncbi:hypothetical protein [Nocardia sp. NPDC050710]|uniref:hypothetical protein n=1 Tax=Nocardia sp. NPDC050710 TaxID=3157220 RepID=UPI0033DA4783
MRAQVTAGRLIEVPTPDATGMDRRAFGEFVGPGGELASYAFGWTTGSDPHVGRFTIGIGAGNPDGGTFHAVIFDHMDVLDLEPGFRSTRSAVGGPWVRHRTTT